MLRRLSIITVLLGLLLTGCTGLPPGYDNASSSRGTYTVRKGDTLYSIAFRYGLDYKSLARINGIAAPFTIYPDQVLKLRGSAVLPKKDSGPKPTTGAQSTAKSPAKPAVSVPDQPVSMWRWPLKGKILAEFSLNQPVNKGIDIAGRAGDRVVAAAEGTVVYAGGNLRGYGKLVIVKHNDTFLSAYGNNESILVKEGDRVRAGKAIARVGSSAGDVEMLHFEIRKDGKPENPRKYLPKNP